MSDAFLQAVEMYGGAVSLVPGGIELNDASKLQSEATDKVVWQAVFGTEEERAAARWLLWELGQITGARPASIQGLYEARGRGECGGFTVPAMNVRMLAYDTARAVFRAAKAGKAGAILLEIARSEISYTDQRPAEYVAVMQGAALREGYSAPLFIQGDHCQVNLKKYLGSDGDEMRDVKTLVAEEIAAGFYNIDIDTSTLVDLSRDTLEDQQRNNYERCAEITESIRDKEPDGVTVSVGGEIGEVGQKNSTVEELHAYMKGYQASLRDLGTFTGISKISVQTGTSHGGVVLPDGSIAEVNIDIDTLAELSRVAREEYGLAGAVQHGASTLPSNAFGNFPRVETCEIHLATNFQNMVFDHPRFPADLKQRMYAYIDENLAGERKESDSEEQFYYKTRKKTIAPFKEEVWSLPEDVRSAIAADLESTFKFLFEQLNVNGTMDLVDRHIRAPVQHRDKVQQAVAVAADDPDAGE
jgi:fructose-bisphosphate aldolase class II